MTKKQSRKTLEILCNIVNDILAEKEERGLYDQKTNTIIAVTPIPEFFPNNPRRLTSFISGQGSNKSFVDELVDSIFDTKSLREVRHEYHELQLDERDQVIPREVEEEYQAVYARVAEILPRKIAAGIQGLYYATLHSILAQPLHLRDTYEKLDFTLSVKAASHVALDQESCQLAEKLHWGLATGFSRYRQEIEGNEAADQKISRMTVKNVCDQLAALKRLRCLAGREFPQRLPLAEVIAIHKLLTANPGATYKCDPAGHAGHLLREFGEFTNAGSEEIQKLYAEKIIGGQQQDRYHWNSVEGRVLTRYLDGYNGRPIRLTNVLLER